MKKNVALIVVLILSVFLMNSVAAQEVKPDSKPDTKTEAKPEAKADPKQEVKPETKPEAKVEPKQEVKPEAKPEAKTEAKPEAKLEPAPQAKPETKVAPKQEAKPEAKPEAKAEAKPEAKPAPAPQAKPETKATPKQEAKPEVKPEAKAEAKPEAKPAPAPQAKPETKVEPKQEAKPEAKPVAKPEAKAESAKEQKGETAQPPNPGASERTPPKGLRDASAPAPQKVQAPFVRPNTASSKADGKRTVTGAGPAKVGEKKAPTEMEAKSSPVAEPQAEKEDEIEDEIEDSEDGDEDSSEVACSVLEVETKFNGAVRDEGAGTAFATFFSRDAVIVSTSIIRSKDWIAGLGNDRELYFKPYAAKVSSSCDYGFVVGDWEEKKKGKVVWGGQYVNIWKKTKGEWKIIVHAKNNLLRGYKTAKRGPATETASQYKREGMSRRGNISDVEKELFGSLQRGGWAKAYDAFAGRDIMKIRHNDTMVVGKKQVFLKSVVERGFLEGNILRVRTSKNKDIAVVFGEAEAKGPQPYQAGSFLHVWDRDIDGAWKLTVDLLLLGKDEFRKRIR